MKKLLLATVVCIISGSVISAYAADQSATAPGTAKHEEKFEKHKAAMLENIGNRIDKLQKLQACIKASTDHKSMRECMPKHEGMGGGMGGGMGAPSAPATTTH